MKDKETKNLKYEGKITTNNDKTTIDTSSSEFMK